MLTLALYMVCVLSYIYREHKQKTRPLRVISGKRFIWRPEKKLMYYIIRTTWTRGLKYVGTITFVYLVSG